MTVQEKREVQKEKILKGLKNSYQKLLDSKKQKNGEIVVLKNNRIENIKFTVQSK